MVDALEQLLARQGPLGQGLSQIVNVQNATTPASGASNESSARDVEPAPCFVLCCPRSGSSLLRALLNHHPEIACPPETDFPHALGCLAYLWATVEAAPKPTELPSPAARKAIAQAVATPLHEFAIRRGKSRWCEKSPTNAEHAGLLLDCFPAANFICVHRHPMDVIVSALEACKWGFRGYGLEPYVRASPDNFVLALLTCWLEKTLAIARFEENHPDKSFRLYYETLVWFPERTLHQLCDFLALSWDPRILTLSLPLPGDLGAGDHKLPYTCEIENSHIGDGSCVPLEYVPPSMLSAVNVQLARLGYPPIGDDWGLAPHPLRQRDYDGCMDDLIETLQRNLREVTPTEPFVTSQLELVLQDRAQEATRLVIDYHNRRVGLAEKEEELPYAVVGSSRILVDIAGGANAGAALRSGTIRVVTRSRCISDLQTYELMKQLVAVLAGHSRGV